MLRIAMADATLSFDRRTVSDLLYETEQRRGYDCSGSLFSPGYFGTTLVPG